jgi:hypothetical protein
MTAETAASRAIRAGEPALAASFRLHRPRGPLCGRGYCGQCGIISPAGAVLACQVAPDRLAASPGRLRVRGRVAERLTPWFWERRLLRPRRLRRLLLHGLGYLWSAPPLGERPPWRPVRAYEEVAAEEVVVGAGGARPDAFAVDPAQGDTVVGVYPERALTLLRGDRMLCVRFERLVLDIGSYERLPPIAGNDLPGVVGLAAAERCGAAGALRPGLRVAVWAAPDQFERAHELAARHGVAIAWLDAVAPRAIAGKRKVEAVITDRRIACELFIVGVRQPAIELALQGGASAALTTDGLPILALTGTPPWLEVVGEAAVSSSGVPDVEAADDAVACPCRDVRVSDLRACVAQGFGHPELVKQRTGAMTGFCQGRLCAAAVLAALREQGVEPTPTRARPLARPIALGELAADA